MSNVPINKGNYSMDSQAREAKFEAYKGEGWDDEYKTYRDDWVRLAKTKTISDYPLLVDLELASVCNLKCPMCYTISPEFRKMVNVKLMDFDLFKKVIDEIGGKVPALRLSLRGEATLHKKFAECIEYAKSNGIKEVSTLTHGGKLDIEFFDKIVKAGIDWITVSIDGMGEQYEKVRKPLKFNDIVAKLTEIANYKKENNVHRPVIKIQGIWPALKHNPQEYYDTFRDISDLIAFNPLIDYLDRDEDIAFMDSFSCPQQYQRLVVGADGLVMKCSNDEENQEVVGDLNSQTVHEVWHGDKMNAVREMHKDNKGFMNSEVCKKCYLPRQTRSDETGIVDGREFIVHNYVNRSQIIGT